MLPLFNITKQGGKYEQITYTDSKPKLTGGGFQ